MMFEPQEDEARRAEALSQASMTTVSTETHSSHTYKRATQLLLERADEIEQYLKNGKEEQAPAPEPQRRTGAFGAYQERGLDAGQPEG